MYTHVGTVPWLCLNEWTEQNRSFDTPNSCSSKRHWSTNTNELVSRSDVARRCLHAHCKPQAIIATGGRVNQCFLITKCHPNFWAYQEWKRANLAYSTLEQQHQAQWWLGWIAKTADFGKHSCLRSISRDYMNMTDCHVYHDWLQVTKLSKLRRCASSFFVKSEQKADFSKKNTSNFGK